MGVAAWVFLGGPPGVDAELLRWMAGLRGPGLSVVAVQVTGLASTAAILVVVAVAWSLLEAGGRRGAGLLLVTSIVGGKALQLGLKALFRRPRPSVVAHLVAVHSSSFPSAHAMMSAITYLTLAHLVAREAGPALRRSAWCGASLLVVLVGVSRIYLGVHHPTDVLAGWLAGVAWTAAAIPASTRWSLGRAGAG